MGRVAGLTADDTRERVLAAAAGVFAQRGFEGARMAEIARSAGLSVGAIYNHYQSKAQLLAAVVERDTAHELGRLLASGPRQGVLDFIAARGRHLEEEHSEEPLLAELILASRRDPEAARILVEEVTGREEIMADFLRFGQRAGDVVADVDPVVIARFCLMLGLGSLLVRALDLPTTDAGAWADVIERLVDVFRTKEGQ
jgi:AcrR family transcriptional regulator